MSKQLELSEQQIREINQAKVKDYLTIDFTEDDDLLDQFGTDQNQHIESKIAPFADTLPFAGDDLTDDIIAAVNYAVCADYKGFIKEYEAEKFWRKKYERMTESITTRLEAIPTDKTDLAVVASEYKSEPLNSREQIFG